MRVREATCKLIEMCEEGILSWESVALAALRYMSESDVADMAHDYEWFQSDDEDDNDND